MCGYTFHSKIMGHLPCHCYLLCRLLNNMAMLWSACHCVAFLVCVLCQPVHSLTHPYISQIFFINLLWRLAIMHLYFPNSYTSMTIVRLNCSYCYRCLYVLSQNTSQFVILFARRFTTKSYISVMAINCVYVCNLYTGCKLNRYGVFIKLWRHHCMQFTVDKVHRKQMNIGALLLLSTTSYNITG